MRRIINSIPNSITLLNLLSGTVAIIFAFSPSALFGTLAGWQWAALMIGAAAIFDFMDGAAARLLHAKSMIGKELDSLADLVSFGVAPAMLMLNVMLEGNNGWVSYSALFIPLMGALRLARFNVDDSQATVFKGLPIPANAIFWIGTVGALYGGYVHPSHLLTLAVIVVISLMMVASQPMFSLKFANFSLRENLRRYIIIIAAVLFVIFLGVAGLAATIILYILLSLVDVKVSYNKGSK